VILLSILPERIQMTTKEIIQELAQRGVIVRLPGFGMLVSGGEPGHERVPRVATLLKLLAERYRRSPRVIERRIRAVQSDLSDPRDRLVN
jgi:hypothetical protein